MSPKQSPSRPFRQGGVPLHKTSLKMWGENKQWVWRSPIFYFLCISLMIPFSSHSQANKESLPIFILQGTVKLKGKPVEGVSLELLKNEKQITQILTRKNGMYSYQMNTSNTDIETEYILKIKKEGAALGILRINTYTVKEGSNYIPYIFNLEINLTLPVASGVMVKQDFGKIKWDSQRGVFDLDKEYVSVVEKVVKNDTDSLKTHSSKYPLAVIDKINKMVESIKTTTDEHAKQNTEDLKTQQLTNENLAKVSAMKESGKKDVNISANENLANVSKIKESEKKDGNISGNEKKENTSDKQKLALGNKKSEQSKAKTEVIDTKPLTSNLNTADSVLKKKTNETAELKNKENTKKILNLKESKEDIENKKEQEAVKIKLENKAKQLSIDNKQQNANPPSVDINPNTFDGLSLFSTNNQKNKLLEDKQKVERKKTENLAKKYETSNILTSLLDVVEAFDEK